MQQVTHDRVEGDDPVRPRQRAGAPQPLHASAQVVGRGAGEAHGDDGTQIARILRSESLQAEPLGRHGRLTGPRSCLDEDVRRLGGRREPLLVGEGIDRPGGGRGTSHTRSVSCSRSASSCASGSGCRSA